MTIEQVQALSLQAEQGRRAETIRDDLRDYLDSVKAETVALLEKELISIEQLTTLQNRLVVIRQVMDRCLRDITSGKLAEQRLREAEDNAATGTV